MNVSLFSCLHFLVFSFIFALFFLGTSASPLDVSLCFPDTISCSAWSSFLYFPVWHTIFFGFPFFLFLLLAQVLPQFTPRYRHDELMSLCNNFFGSCVLTRNNGAIQNWFFQTCSILMVQYLTLQKKSSDRLIFIIRSHGSSSDFTCHSIS